MSEHETPAQREERQSQEVTASQRKLQESITATKRLVEKSEEMLLRHRKERAGDDETDP